MTPDDAVGHGQTQTGTAFTFRREEWLEALVEGFPIPESGSMWRSSRTRSGFSSEKRSAAMVGQVTVVQAVYPFFFNIRASAEAQWASSSMIRMRASLVIFVGGAINSLAEPKNVLSKLRSGTCGAAGVIRSYKPRDKRNPNGVLYASGQEHDTFNIRGLQRAEKLRSLENCKGEEFRIAFLRANQHSQRPSSTSFHIEKVLS